MNILAEGGLKGLSHLSPPPFQSLFLSDLSRAPASLPCCRAEARAGPEAARTRSTAARGLPRQLPPVRPPLPVPRVTVAPPCPLRTCETRS